MMRVIREYGHMTCGGCDCCTQYRPLWLAAVHAHTTFMYIPTGRTYMYMSPGKLDTVAPSTVHMIGQKTGAELSRS